MSGQGGLDVSGRRNMPWGAYWKRPDAEASASGQFSRSVRSTTMTVEIGRIPLNAGDTWNESVDRTLSPESGQYDRSVRSERVLPSEGV